jgi:SanA protein
VSQAPPGFPSFPPHREDEPHAPSLGDKLKRQARVELSALNQLFRRWILRVIIIGAHIVLVLVACYFIVGWMGGACYDKIDDVPVRYTGLVLGCVKKVGKYDNEFFTARVDAAAKLFHAGKVSYLIVSGDNNHDGYDEPTDLKAALVAKGVPPNKIYCDYAGLRTLDSVMRARAVFGQVDCTVISQHFHNQRALYIAQRQGMEDMVAFNAADPESQFMLKMYLREIFSRVKAVLDVEFLHSQPKFLGSRVFMGEKTPPIDAVPLPGTGA